MQGIVDQAFFPFMQLFIHPDQGSRALSHPFFKPGIQDAELFAQALIFAHDEDLAENDQANNHRYPAGDNDRTERLGGSQAGKQNQEASSHPR